MAGDSYAVLHETLAKVRARIVELSDHDDRISEEETKAILIDPVLSVLGWRVDELQDVRREYRAKPQDSPVDYALLAFGKPRLFVEAKALSTALDRKSASQLLGYAAVVGVGWGVGALVFVGLTVGVIVLVAPAPSSRAYAKPPPRSALGAPAAALGFMPSTTSRNDPAPPPWQV